VRGIDGIESYPKNDSFVNPPRMNADKDAKYTSRMPGRSLTRTGRLGGGCPLDMCSQYIPIILGSARTIFTGGMVRGCSICGLNNDE
jgi:hypothetical protein